MLNSETLEVGIGMAFLFLLMSLICTAVKEWIEGVLKWRAMDLERALRTLLDDNNGAITALLYRHPLIYSLFQGPYDPSQIKHSPLTPGRGAQHMRLRARRNLPSYIPAENFAMALLDLVARGPAAADEAAESAAVHLSVEELRERAAMLGSPHLRRVMLSAIDHSGGDLERLKLNLQRWFDGTMDRAAGWYKRRTQAVLFMVGIGVAAALNVDALYVMGRLTADKTLRDLLVQEAASLKGPDAAASMPLHDRIRDARNELQKVEVPVGWRKATADGLFGQLPRQWCTAPEGDACVRGGDYGWLRIAIGWLITAFAVMLGAPFWFDVLNKFMVIRSTVKPHEKSPEEGSEDRREKAPQQPPRGDRSGKDGDSDGNTGESGQSESDANSIVASSSNAAALSPAVPAAASFEPHRWREGFSNSNEVKL